MKQTLELSAVERPIEQSAIPEAATTVEAGSLLRAEERKSAAQRGWLFGVEVDGKTYLTPAHRQVPAQATIPRTSAGSLIGVSAVTGG